MIVLFWRRRRTVNRPRIRHVAAWAALDTCPTVPATAGIWPAHQPNMRAGGR